MIGSMVGNYRIVERLGDGGMGAVYRAIDEMLDREVAIKVLKPELARNASLIERFRLEAVALARLNHPRIATLHGLERHGESLLMIMEYVRGDTLEAIVQRSGRIAWPRACELCAAVLDALDHAHDKGVVHRDIKPANVMLASNGALKVMDFGIARLMGKSRQTQVGHAVGTPMYMAPEQLRGDEVDGRTDLYAVGAVLFELVTGRLPFEADSDYALMMMQLNEPPPAASSLVTEVPSAVDNIIRRAMAKRREDRFASAMAFRDELLQIVGALSVPSSRTPIPAETRLAVEPILGSHAVHPAESYRTRVAAAAGWARDWRTYTIASAVLVAAGLGVRTLRTPATDGSEVAVVRPDTMAAQRSGLRLPPVPPVPEQDEPSARGEDASSLILNPPTTGAGGIGSGGSRDRLAVPPPVQPTQPGKEALPRKSEPPGSDAPPRDEAPPDRGARRADSVESESASIQAIHSAIASAATMLSGQSASVSSLIDGSVREQWATLMKEGRISMNLSGLPDVRLHGQHATAEFDASVNVRSPFGATRRRNARFVADLQRSGDTWHVTSLRPQGKLELK